MPGVAASLRTWGEMIKFSHSVFALPFAMLATFLAARPDRPSAAQIGLILVCMVAARSAAMTFNRLADRRIDAANPRTSDRHLPRGRIGVRTAWVFFACAALAFAGGCAGFYWLSGNPWPLALCGPVLVCLCAYSYTKRFTVWSHALLGAGIAVSPPAAWLAIRPETLGAAAGLLGAAVLFWIAGFDLIYACQDAAFDRAAGLFSVPGRFGVAAALMLARGCHALTVAALIGLASVAGLGMAYYVGVGCVTVLLIVENALVSPSDLSRVNLAFFTVNGIVGLVLGLLGIVDVLMS